MVAQLTLVDQFGHDLTIKKVYEHPNQFFWLFSDTGEFFPFEHWKALDEISVNKVLCIKNKWFKLKELVYF